MNKDLDLRCNFINADKTIARNSYGGFFKIGDKVEHEGANDGGAIISSFEVDETSNEIKAHTDKGWSHLDFIFKTNKNE